MSLGRLGSYEILERIGAGRMGVVFRALDTRPERLGRVVALKVLDQSLAGEPEFRARLLREARAEAAISHTHIATCFEAGEAPLEPPTLLDPAAPAPPAGVPFLAMEYVDGEDLEALASRGPLPIARAVDLGLQIAAGLEAAHRLGIVHRDLKPGNVRVTGEGIAKILDFGLARVCPVPGDSAPTIGSSITTTENRLLGTPYYMSPEQARAAPLDARSDLFSLGSLLYRLIAGRVPFAGQDVMGVLSAVMNEEPQPLARYAAGVPPELQRIVSKLLAKRVGERYQSAHEVVTDLQRLRDARPPARHGALFAAAVVVALAALPFVLPRVRDLIEAPPRNVVVLPFSNATGDSTLDHVGDGLADEVRGDLVRRTTLDVVGTEATVQAGRSGTPRSLAKALGVRALVSGRLRHEADETRLEVELVDARSGFVRWSSVYTWSFAAASRIKRDIVDQVAARLAGGLRRAVEAKAPTSSLSAYDAYLKGIRALDDPDDPLAPDRASELFGRALALDPEFALAWAGRSIALFRIHARDQTPQSLRGAEQAAAEAVRLAPDAVEGHVALAQIYRGTGRTKEAIAELQRVLAVNPNLFEALQQLGATYRDAGQLPLAERSFRRAVDVRPDFWRAWNSLGAILLRRGDRAGARAAFERIVALAPEINRGYEQLAALDQLEGRWEDALREYRRLPTPVNDAVLASNIASACMTVGRLSEARDYLARAVSLEPENPIARENLGDLLVKMGRPAEARAAYAEAARCVEEALRDDPAKLDLLVQRVLYRAKAGDCDGATRALAAVDPGRIAEMPEALYALARAHAACGRRAIALETLRRAVDHGIAPRRALGEVEFAAGSAPTAPP